MNNHYECIIVGGGIAGSSAAFRLARLGYKTALLEKTKGPHHKVCGGFLSFETIQLLEELGVHLNEEYPTVKNLQIFSPQRNIDFNFPLPGRGVSRYQLDETLIHNAKEAGADLFRGVSMQDYAQSRKGGFRIQTSLGEFTSEHLFIATGKHDFSKKHKRCGMDESYVGLQTYIHLGSLQKVFKHTTSLFTFPGGYSGICPIEGDLLNLCFILKKDIHKSFQGNFDITLNYLRSMNPRLNLVLQNAQIVGPACAIGHIPYGFLSPDHHFSQAYRLGDQSMVVPSFTGEGMSIALNTAKDAVAKFNAQQKGILLKKRRNITSALKQQLRWALLGHFILKSTALLNICMLFPKLGRLLIEVLFKKTRFVE